jgi:hypothetical protein
MSEARILDITDAEYFADPLPTPSLSSSLAHTLVTKSPYHAWLEHPKLGGIGRPPTKAKDNGSLVHSLLLGTGKEIAVIDAEDFRTKAAREDRDAAREAGRVPVLRKDADDAGRIVDDIRKGFDEIGIRFTGASEVKVTWTEDTTAGPVVCRGMMDHVIRDRGVIYDVKTCRSAHPKACTSHVIEYGYDIQRAAYTSAFRKLEPGLAGREDFIFLFVEELPEDSPRRVVITPARLDGSLRQLGGLKWERACELWVRCVRDSSWPAYTDGPQPIFLEAPGWAIPQELARTA